jgi:hypothetical protein
MPPEIHVADNGFVIRTYDVSNDSMRYRIAGTVEEVRAALDLWVDAEIETMRRAMDYRLNKAREDLERSNAGQIGKIDA